MGALSSDNLGGRHVSNLITPAMPGVELVSLNRSGKMNRQTRCTSARLLRARLTKRRLPNDTIVLKEATRDTRALFLRNGFNELRFEALLTKWTAITVETNRVPFGARERSRSQ